MQVRTVFVRFIFWCCVGALPVAELAAQTHQEALEQINRAIQLEEQRRNEARRQIEESQRTHSTLPQQNIPPPPPLGEGGPCFTVKIIRVEGVTRFSSLKIAAVYQPLLDTCVSLADIDHLISRLTNLYIEAGFVTSRAYIPQQNLSSGELLIKVVEGHIESLRIEGGPARLAAVAFPGLVGQVLNLREIEQGLDQLRRLRSASASIQFVPGEALGATEVVVHYRRDEPHQVNLGYNNSGQEATGLYKVSGGLGWDSPLGLSDFLYLNHSTNARDEAPGSKSNSSSIHYSLPLGYWNLALDLNQFEYANLVHGSATTFTTRGTSEIQQLSVDRLLMRGQNSKTTLSLHYKKHSSESFIDDVLLLTSSRDTDIVGIKLQQDRYLQGNKTLLMSLGYDRGLKTRYHSETVNQSPGMPEENFSKYSMDLTLMGAVQWLQNTWQWRTELHGQHSDDILYSSEAFAIGSLYTVRGFKETGLSDDSGIYWRNELSLPAFPFRRMPRVRTEPFIGVDAGWVANNDQLSGWAMGLRLSGPHLSAQVAYARALDHPDHLSVKKHAVDFSLSLSKGW